MPESKVRKKAENKKKSKNASELAEKRSESKRLAPRSRNWVPWVFIPMGLIGVFWMVVYQLAGNSIGFMGALGDWNMLISMLLVVGCFGFMTLWK